MGIYLTVKRKTVTSFLGHEIECKWCPQKKKVMFIYNGIGPFCNKECFTCYNDGWPTGPLGEDLPILYAGRR
jgi:hypothetical protein